MIDKYSSNSVARVKQLIPQAIQDRSTGFLPILEEYFKFKGLVDNPTYSLKNLIKNKDIDLADTDYLLYIKDEVAKYLPQNSAIDERLLYRFANEIYRSKGSVESVKLFFRLFFNTTAGLYYPKDDLLITDEGIIEDDYIEDGFYYQEYSYQINLFGELENWYELYNRIIHPAGLKIFVSTTLLFDDEFPLDYMSEDFYLDISESLNVYQFNSDMDWLEYYKQDYTDNLVFHDPTIIAEIEDIIVDLVDSYEYPFFPDFVLFDEPFEPYLLRENGLNILLEDGMPILLEDEEVVPAILTEEEIAIILENGIPLIIEGNILGTEDLLFAISSEDGNLFSI